MSEIEAFIAAQSAAFNAVKAPPAPAPPVQAPGPALVVQAAPAPALVVMAQAIAPNPLAPHMDAILDEEARNLVKQGAEAEKDVILEDGGVLPISINIVELFGETPNEEEVGNHPVYRYGFKPNPFVSRALFSFDRTLIGI